VALVLWPVHSIIDDQIPEARNIVFSAASTADLASNDH